MTHISKPWGVEKAAGGDGSVADPFVPVVQVDGLGSSTTIKVTPTVTAGAYTAGDCLGGLLTLANAARVSAGGTFLHEIVINAKSSEVPTGTILFFDASPAASTFADKTTAVWHATDLAKCVGSKAIVSGDWVALAGSQYQLNLDLLSRLIHPASGTTLYAAIVLDNTPTPGSTSDYVVIAKFAPRS